VLVTAASEHGAAPHAGAEEGARLGAVHLLEGVRVYGGATFRLQVHDLPADEAGGPGRLGEDGGGGQPAPDVPGVGVGGRVGHDLEGSGQQRVAHEDGDALAEDLV